MLPFVTIPNLRSLSDQGTYVALVEAALRDPAIFAQFRRAPAYREIVETVSAKLGMYYLSLIQSEDPGILEMMPDFKINDLVGGPEVVGYPGIGEISPTSVRYVKVASDLRRRFGDLSGFRIAEIGVGYGGQLRILDQLFPKLEYHLFDLPPVLDLASKYLESFILRGSYHTRTLNSSTGRDEFDLVISNYAFSELPSTLQLGYVEKILARCRRGYMTMNSGFSGSTFQGNFLSVDALRDLLPPFDVRPEFQPSHKTHILTWG